MLPIEKDYITIKEYISYGKKLDKAFLLKELNHMKKKYQITGFARLLIFMMLFSPIAYIGASYYQGEDGIEKIKSLFENESNNTVEAKISKKKKEIKDLENKLEVYQKDLQRLEKESK